MRKLKTLLIATIVSCMMLSMFSYKEVYAASLKIQSYQLTVDQHYKKEKQYN